MRISDWSSDVCSSDLATTGSGGLEADRDLRVLTGATRLLLVRVGVLDDRLGDGLAVRHLRLADGGVDLELAQHEVYDYLEVQLAHAGADGLARVLVGPDLDRRVLMGAGEASLAQLDMVDPR